MAEEHVEKILCPPVKVGDIIEGQEVINTGKKNDGVVKYNDYIVFVNDCAQGDIIDFEMEKVLPKFGIGKRIFKEDKLEDEVDEE